MGDFVDFEHRRALCRHQSGQPVLLGVVDCVLNLLQAETVVGGQVLAFLTAVYHLGDRHRRHDAQRTWAARYMGLG